MAARVSRVFVALSCLSLLAACTPKRDVEFTLYRTGVDFETDTHAEAKRIHIATFDAAPLEHDEDNGEYNRANCEFTQELFSASQPHLQGSVFGHIKLRYWCEKGAVKK
jgi:hypothetical protein